MGKAMGTKLVISDHLKSSNLVNVIEQFAGAGADLSFGLGGTLHREKKLRLATPNSRTLKKRSRVLDNER